MRMREGGRGRERGRVGSWGEGRKENDNNCTSSRTFSEPTSLSSLQELLATIPQGPGRVKRCNPIPL